MWPSISQALWSVSSAVATVFKRNYILALFIKFTNDAFTYKANDTSSWPLTGLRARKECYFLKSYMACVRRRKTDLYGWAGISAFGEVWLTYKTDIWCVLDKREENKGKVLCFNIYCLALKYVFLFYCHVLCLCSNMQYINSTSF